MNQKGEVTLFSVLGIVILTGIFLLCSLELRHSFNQLQKRSHLFLCMKESKGELQQYLKFMGRSNWAIANITKASIVMLFIPGLQAAAFNVDKAKKQIFHLQNIRHISYLKTLTEIKTKQCPIDPRMFITPFELEFPFFRRDRSGQTILRNKEWSYVFVSLPFVLNLKNKALDLDAMNPIISYETSEKAERLLSPFF